MQKLAVLGTHLLRPSTPERWVEEGLHIAPAAPALLTTSDRSRRGGQARSDRGAPFKNLGRISPCKKGVFSIEQWLNAALFVAEI